MIGEGIEQDLLMYPFRGLNVILLGDFHQFPPVATKKPHPLLTEPAFCEMSIGQKHLQTI